MGTKTVSLRRLPKQNPHFEEWRISQPGIFLFSILVSFENSKSCYFRFCEKASHRHDQERTKESECRNVGWNRRSCP